MKIFIADKFQSSGVEKMKAARFEVEYQPDAKGDALAAAVKATDPDVLVVRSTKAPRAVLEAGERLSLVVRAGAGVDNIDVQAASELAIFVTNCPGKNSIAVAELTMALLLACDRRIPDNVVDLRAGKWMKAEYAKARGLAGRTLGIVGCGSIGREVVRRAKAFGMTVVAWSRSLTPELAAEMGVRMAASPVDVARIADAVSLHFAANDQTRGIANAEFFDAMKKGAYFINTTRGSVVDEAALKRVIREKGVRAGLDVFANEPAGGEGTFSEELFSLPGVYGTHHIGASTDQAQDAIADETVRILVEYRRSGAVLHCINMGDPSHAKTLLVVRHRNQPGVLAGVFDVISHERINVETMDNLVYEGGASACARVHLASPISSDAVKRIRSGNPNILSVAVAALD